MDHDLAAVGDGLGISSQRVIGHSGTSFRNNSPGSDQSNVYIRGRDPKGGGGVAGMLEHLW